MSTDESFLDMLAGVLKQVRLEAILVGNAAAILHGAPVLTQDVDLLVRDTPLNRRKLRKLALAIGGSGPDLISDLTTSRRILGAAVPVDVIFDYLSGGLSFASVRSRGSKLRVVENVMTVASLEDIIRSKEAAGRAKDVAHLPILRDTLRVKQALAHDAGARTR